MTRENDAQSITVQNIGMENMTAMSSENFIPLQTINFYVTTDNLCAFVNDEILFLIHELLAWNNTLKCAECRADQQSKLTHTSPL